MFFDASHLEEHGHKAAAPSTRSACQQAIQWSVRCSRRGGYDAWHSSVAKLQRGAKMQPFGKLVSAGTMPLISFNLARRPLICAATSTLGMEPSSPFV